MPIEYEIQNEGRFINATARGIVTDEDFIKYETIHVIDERIKPPVDEMLEIAPSAAMRLTHEGIRLALKKNKELGRHKIRHRCAIVVRHPDEIVWDLAKFYESMARMHAPSSVIVFANPDIARLWLGRPELKKHVL
jgi:hypothetical protein